MRVMSEWATVIIAVAGILGTLGASYLTAQMGAQERQKDRLDAQAARSEARIDERNRNRRARVNAATGFVSTVLIRIVAMNREDAIPWMTDDEEYRATLAEADRRAADLVAVRDTTGDTPLGRALNQEHILAINLLHLIDERRSLTDEEWNKRVNEASLAVAANHVAIATAMDDLDWPD
jgi:hypothetical protein